MITLLSASFILLNILYHFHSSFSLPQQQQLQIQQPFSLPNPCNDKCGKLQIPFPFHLNTSCGSISNSFHLSCSNSTTLILNVGLEKYHVLEFFSDGLLVDFPGSASCRLYNDLNSFGFQKNHFFGISVDNIVGLYDCEDSSLCKAGCETNELPGCDGNRSESPACCYPLDDHSVWQVGNDFSVFSKFGCRGFSSWVVPRGSNSGKRGVKLEWAIPRNLSNEVCDGNAYVENSTVIEDGVRCLCEDGYSGDGFANGVGCLKSCIKEGHEVYGSDCHTKRHNQQKLLIMAGVLAALLILSSLIVLFALLRRPDKSITLDSHAQFRINHSFQKSSRTRLFNYRELEEATRGFGENQKLIDSRNGRIYVGFLTEGSHIAVHKVQCENGGDLIQIISQIEVLSSIAHKNMACILGYCIVSGYTQTPSIVYEYPSNGTLQQHLHYRKGKNTLDWYKRLNIATETASVLAFLQYEFSPPIFHNDLKSGYIFLDTDYSAKIAGFGILNSTECKNVEGTQKNDVYDFGVLLLEIISGSNSLDLPVVSLQKIRSGKLEEIVDPVLYYHEQPAFRREQIETVADLATRCLLFGGDRKLGMIDVARELVHMRKESVDGGGSKRKGLEETFSNSSLLQMVSMSPDSIYVPRNIQGL